MCHSVLLSVLIVICCLMAYATSRPVKKKTTKPTSKIPPESDVNRFVYHCFYQVDKKELQKDPRHRCHQLSKVVKVYRPFSKYEAENIKAVSTFARTIRIIQEYRRLLKLKADDEKLALECFIHQYDTDYQLDECKGLLFDRPEKPNDPREKQKLAFFDRLNWPLIDWKKESFENPADEDKARAFDCHRNNDKESCRGITWGKAIVSADRLARRMEYYNRMEKDRNCMSVYCTFDGVKPPQLSLAEIDHEKTLEYAADKALVSHCYYFHQRNTSVEQCRGISYDRPQQVKTLRQAHLAHLWKAVDQAEKEVVIEKVDQGVLSVVDATIQLCLHTIDWNTRSYEWCKRLVSNDNTTDEYIQMFERTKAQLAEEDKKFDHRKLEHVKSKNEAVAMLAKMHQLVQQILDLYCHHSIKI